MTEVRSHPAVRQKRAFSYSLTHLGIFAALILLLITLLILSFVSFYYQGRFREQYTESMIRQQSQFDRDTVSDLATLDHQLFQLGMYDTSISLLNTTSDPMTFYRAKMTIYRNLSNLLPIFSEVDGLFFYSPSANDFTPSTGLATTSECADAIKSYLSDNRENAFRLGDAYSRWEPVQIGANCYLVRMVSAGNSVLGTWTSLSTLLRGLKGQLPEECRYGIWHKDFLLQPSTLFPDYVFDEKAETATQLYQSATGERYMVYAFKTSYSDCYFVIFTPLTLLTSQLTPVMKGGILLALAVVLTVTVISVFTKRLIDLPIRPMKRALATLQDGGEKTAMLTTDSHCVEIRQLFQVLNDQLRDIRELEAQLYKDQIERSSLELHFLKAQLTPHFLINCLNTFSYLAASEDESDRDTAQRMIETLSQHIRYSFDTGDVITLAEEFSHLDNYLELAYIRYPGSLSYAMQLPPECEQAHIPPMTLMTLCENSLKHNLIMGEHLNIHIDAERVREKERDWIRIAYVDSGIGYPPEVLERCNHILEHEEDVRNGQHIGIYAIVKAMHLVYREEASLVFSNEPGAGARVELRFPLKRKEEL